VADAEELALPTNACGSVTVASARRLRLGELRGGLERFTLAIEIGPSYLANRKGRLVVFFAMSTPWRFVG
jgi:hypothetical protein